MIPTVSIRIRILTTLALVLLLVGGAGLTGPGGPVWSAGNTAAPSLAAPGVNGGGVNVPSLSSPDAATRARVKATFDRLPLYFIENGGQLDPQVAYYVQGHDKTLYFTPEGVTFVLSDPTSRPPSLRGKGELHDPLRLAEEGTGVRATRWVVKLDFVGANHVRPIGQEKAEAIISYFKGRPDQWHTGIPTYHRILYRDLWPGIDLAFYGTAQHLKFEFIVYPGADPGRIRLAYRGAEVKLNAAGQLEVTTPLGSFTDEAPIAYQEIEGRQVDVAVAYRWGISDFGFQIGQSYDPTRPLVIDPTILIYCGYIGGSNWDEGSGIAVGGAGRAYVVGYTESSESMGFPVTVGPDLTYNGGADAFVARVRADGRGLEYCGYIGGSGSDYGSGIAVDGAGRAYVVGYTYSSESAGFPVAAGPDLTFNGGYDVFVARVGEVGYSISGHVRDGSGNPIPGVTISDGAGHTTTTDSNGNYTLSGLAAGTYTITPSKSGYTFSPLSRQVTVPPNATGVDFVGGEAAGPDLWVDHIQVAQVFLADTDPANGQPIPLIAEKLTLVRVYVGVSGATSIPNVTARLYVQDAQGQVHVVNQTYNGMPITAKANPDPHKLNDTVNFLPPVAWLKGNVTFWAEVDPANQVAESNESNNVGGNVTKTFQAGHKLRIAWVEMPYAPPNPPPSLVYADAAAAAAGFNFLQRIYPVGISDVEYFRQPTQMLEVMRSKFTVQAASSDYIPALERFWQITTRRNGWQGGTAPDRLYGLVPDAARYTDPIPIHGTLCGIAGSKWAGLRRVPGMDHSP